MVAPRKMYTVNDKHLLLSINCINDSKFLHNIKKNLFSIFAETGVKTWDIKHLCTPVLVSVLTIKHLQKLKVAVPLYPQKVEG